MTKFVDAEMALTLLGSMSKTLVNLRAADDKSNRDAGRFGDFDADLKFTGDWDWAKEDWTHYIGPRLRDAWNTLTPELRHMIAEDFEERASSDWSDSIDARGEDS